MSIEQPELFPIPEHPSGRLQRGTDEWVQSVRDSARVNPYYEEEKRELQGTGIVPDLDGMKRQIDVSTSQDDTRSVTDKQPPNPVDELKKTLSGSKPVNDGTKPIYGPKVGFIERRRETYKRDNP